MVPQLRILFQYQGHQLAHVLRPGLRQKTQHAHAAQLHEAFECFQREGQDR